MDNLTKFMVEVHHNTIKYDNVRTDWRIGQTFFNTLNQMDPECADMIRGGPFDPFYDDSKIPAFLLEVFGWSIIPRKELAKKSIGELIEKDLEKTAHIVDTITHMTDFREIAMTNHDASKNLEDRSFYRGQINVCDYFLTWGF